MPIQQHASTLLSRLQTLLNRIVSEQTRSQFYSNISTFAQEQPLLASFLTLQLLISATPLFLFLSFTLSVLFFSLITALLFSLFWIGLALIILVPTLFVTVGLGIGVWVWALCSFVVVRWIYRALPVSVKGKVGVNGSGEKTVVF